MRVDNIMVSTDTPLRLDVALVHRGLAMSRSRGRDLIVRGLVRVDGVLATKVGMLVDEDAVVTVAEGSGADLVSRGGLKLQAGLAAFGFNAQGCVALDVGASTGGFSEVLLKAGAAKVYAVDVGHGQLDERLKADPRVVSMEGQDARALKHDLIPEPIGAIVADLSFISLLKVLPAALALSAPGAWLTALVKPQFEAGREGVGKGGIVRDEHVRAAAVAKVKDWVAAQPGWDVVGVVPSPITGGSGNEEFLLGARRND